MCKVDMDKDLGGSEMGAEDSMRERGEPLFRVTKEQRMETVKCKLKICV